jgi:cytochrome c peroxidase
MARYLLPVSFLLVVGGLALPGDPVPKDTLPAKLTLDDIPVGLPARDVPKDNPLTEARVALGRRLFFDPILSADNTVACASCHRPDHGFSSGDAKPRGIRNQALKRKAPTLFNRAYGTAFSGTAARRRSKHRRSNPSKTPPRWDRSSPTW